MFFVRMRLHVFTSLRVRKGGWYFSSPFATTTVSGGRTSKCGRWFLRKFLRAIHASHLLSECWNQQQIGQRRGSTANRKCVKTTKCARPQKDADERKGIKRGSYMICEFIRIAIISRRRVIAFFDRMILGGWVRYKNNTAYLHQIPPCVVSKSSLVCDKRKETAAYF